MHHKQTSIRAECCGVISIWFCFTYSLNGVTSIKRGLHARLCRAFLNYLLLLVEFTIQINKQEALLLHRDCANTHISVEIWTFGGPQTIA